MGSIYASGLHAKKKRRMEVKKRQERQAGRFRRQGWKMLDKGKWLFAARAKKVIIISDYSCAAS